MCVRDRILTFCNVCIVYLTLPSLFSQKITNFRRIFAKVLRVLFIYRVNFLNNNNISNNFFIIFQIFRYFSCIFAHIQRNFLNLFKKLSRKTKIVFRETRELKFSCGFPYRFHLSSCPPPPPWDWSPASSHFRPGSLLLTQPATRVSSGIAFCRANTVTPST